jgi:flagellar basal-body rod protein FlgB
MPITDLPLFWMLRTRMHWHQERQRLLAENVSNVDTLQYRPRDLALPQFNENISTAQRPGGEPYRRKIPTFRA